MSASAIIRGAALALLALGSVAPAHAAEQAYAQVLPAVDAARCAPGELPVLARASDIAAGRDVGVQRTCIGRPSFEPPAPGTYVVLVRSVPGFAGATQPAIARLAEPQERHAAEAYLILMATPRLIPVPAGPAELPTGR